MRTMIERSLLTGIGLLSLTREKAHEIVDGLVQRGEVQRDEAKDLIDRLVKRGEEERKAMHQLVRDDVTAVMNELDLVTKKDIQNLAAKIDALNKK